jgi:hypothetical protein
MKCTRTRGLCQGKTRRLDLQRPANCFMYPRVVYNRNTLIFSLFGGKGLLSFTVNVSRFPAVFYESYLRPG